MIKRRKYPAQFSDLFSRRDLLKRAVELSKKRGIKFGIVEHPGRGYRIVNDEALKKDIAIEINEPAKVPKIKFVKMAKKAGAKFTFGTDSRSNRAGKFEYCLQMAKQSGLTKKDMFVLKPDGKKAIQRKNRDSQL